MALAMGLMALVEDGRVDLDRDVSEYLGWRLVNPAFPDRPVTARRLLSHTSSIRDPEEYWIAAPGRFRDLAEGAGVFASTTDAAGGARADWFKYANINYGILAGVIEGASQQRFDLFMSDYLFKSMQLDIGFNWSGVSSAARKEGAALPRREGKGWISIVDGPSVLSDDIPYFLASNEIDRREYLEGYLPGENPTLFSPQGGLRASAVDLVALVRKLNDYGELKAPVWRYDAAAPNGDTENGLYSAFGLGVQIVTGDGFLLPRGELVGHAGDAYGLYSGAWLLKADPAHGRGEDLAFAFAAIGVDEAPVRSARSSFNAIEERLIRLALQAAGPHANNPAKEPRPFDEEANATQDIEAALLSARSTGKMPLLILGGNWCHDSRGLAGKFDTEPLKSVIEDNFHIVWIDIGRRDRNLEVAKRFGVDRIIGTPTVIILSPDGKLANRDTVHEWRAADSKSLKEATDYFSSFIAAPR
jgi:CubicO group peptidase (beta-lactamase class C family)